jgi:hypothetical protein
MDSSQALASPWLGWEASSAGNRTLVSQAIIRGAGFGKLGQSPARS